MTNPTPILLAVLIGLLPNLAQAQRLEPGARVRVRPPCERDAPCDPIIGEFRSMQGDTVMIVDGNGESRSLLLTRTTRFDLSHGMRGRWLEGLGVGLAAGMVAGFLATGLCKGANHGDPLCSFYYLFTLPPGLLLGGIVGAHYKTELWLPARRVAVVVVPTRSGIGMGMRLVL